MRGFSNFNIFNSSRFYDIASANFWKSWWKLKVSQDCSNIQRKKNMLYKDKVVERDMLDMYNKNKPNTK